MAVVVAIDFGTARSGFAFALKSRPDDIGELLFCHSIPPSFDVLSLFILSPRCDVFVLQFVNRDGRVMCHLL